MSPALSFPGNVTVLTCQLRSCRIISIFHRVPSYIIYYHTGSTCGNYHPVLFAWEHCMGIYAIAQSSAEKPLFLYCRQFIKRKPLSKTFIALCWRFATNLLQHYNPVAEVSPVLVIFPFLILSISKKREKKTWWIAVGRKAFTLIIHNVISQQLYHMFAQFFTAFNMMKTRIL